MDKAYLTRTYAEIRNTWNTESVSEDKNLTKISRTYVVLKAEHDRGYSNSNFTKHPSNQSYGSDDDNHLAWDFLPETIIKTEPGELQIEDFGGAANYYPSALKRPMIGGRNLQTLLLTVVLKINT